MWLARLTAVGEREQVMSGRGDGDRTRGEPVAIAVIAFAILANKDVVVIA